MAIPTLSRRELKGARIYFIPLGETVDGITVSATTWPDNDPLTNYTNFQLPDIETVEDFKSESSEVFMIPGEIGGYDEDEEMHLHRRGWTATTAKTSTLIKRLQHAVAAPVVASAAQAPGTIRDNFILGVFLIEIQGKLGAIIERTQVWAKFRLIEPGTAGPETAKLTLRFEQLYSGNNTFVAL